MIDVKLEKFEGPLSLLLQLIEKEELDITQISLAKIADQYIEYIRKSAAINPEEMADFLVVAAKLLLIKSKALLPFLFPEEEEEIEELEHQLLMYKEFLEAAKKINTILNKGKFMFAKEFNRKAVMNGAKFFSPPKKLIAVDMATVFGELIERVKPAEKLEETTIEDKINIEDKIFSIKNLIKQRIKLSFNQVLNEARSKTEVIVSFLAILELMRQKHVILAQDELFSEIVISEYVITEAEVAGISE
jgi:segregation and condensation protein A